MSRTLDDTGKQVINNDISKTKFSVTQNSGAYGSDFSTDAYQCLYSGTLKT